MGADERTATVIEVGEFHFCQQGKDLHLRLRIRINNDLHFRQLAICWFDPFDETDFRSHFNVTYQFEGTQREYDIIADRAFFWINGFWFYYPLVVHDFIKSMLFDKDGHGSKEWPDFLENAARVILRLERKTRWSVAKLEALVNLRLGKDPYAVARLLKRDPSWIEEFQRELRKGSDYLRLFPAYAFDYPKGFGDNRPGSLYSAVSQEGIREFISKASPQVGGEWTAKKLVAHMAIAVGGLQRKPTDKEAASLMRLAKGTTLTWIDLVPRETRLFWNNLAPLLAVFGVEEKRLKLIPKRRSMKGPRLPRSKTSKK